MKKKLSVLLVLVFIFTTLCSTQLITSASSSNEFYRASTAICKERAEMFLQSIGHPLLAVTNPVELKNLEGEIEAISFTIGDTGYIIVNVNDLSIPELSLENPNPFSGFENSIYNGPLQYYYESEGQIKSIIENSIIDNSKFANCYKREKITNQQEYMQILKSEYNSNSRAATTERYLSAPLQPWSNETIGICGSVAAAICMRFYEDNVSSIYVEDSLTSRDDLVWLMRTYLGEIDRYGTFYGDVALGLNDYFTSRAIQNTAVWEIPFNFSELKQRIRANRPVIVGTQEDSEYGKHWIIAHGYFESRVDGEYIIVNNGWGRNNVWVYPNSETVHGMIYFLN